MDTNLLQSLYMDPTLRLPDIAVALGCSVTTVRKWRKFLGLPNRYAIPWYPPALPTPELAYLLGAWITDGHLSLKNGQICVFNTASEFADHVEHCASLFRPGHVRRANYPNHASTHKGTLANHRIMIFSLAFAEWIAEHFGRKKNKIASYILDAPQASAIAFLSAIIDGDGHVSKEGNIRIRGSFGWLLDVPKLCQALGIRCSNPRLVRILPSGREFHGISINRTDFLRAGGKCIIASKQERLLHPTYRRVIAIANNSWPCPNCGNPRANPIAKLCRACYDAARKPAANLCSTCGAALSTPHAKLCQACYHASTKRPIHND